METSIAIWVNIAIILATLLAGYIFGSIPTSLIVGKVFFKTDPRQYGSHNLGATNSGRVFGKRIGFLIIILDAFKLILPLWGFWAILTFTNIGTDVTSPLYLEPLRNSLIDGLSVPQTHIQYYYLTALGCSLGHCFPLFAGLKGGKSVSCLAGFMFFTNWLFTIVLIIVFFAILCSKKYVSLASVSTVLVCGIICWLSLIPSLTSLPFYGNGLAMIGGTEFATTVTLISIIVIARHHSNIKRLLSGTETKITWLDRKPKEVPSTTTEN